MFGLEDQDGKKKEEVLSFDLEDEARDVEKHAALQQRLHNNLFKIKDLLRSGEVQEDFEKFGHLVFGYTSLLQVLKRVRTPLKKS